MNILGVIPARGGSKGIKEKNILDIKGKPLIGYTVEDALSSDLINKVVVSTDSDKISDTVERMYDIDVVRRPAEFARDDSPIEEALLHTMEYLESKEGYKTDILVWMQANVPIRKKGVVDEAINKFINDKADSCVTCYEAEQIPEAMKIIDSNGMLVPMFKNVDGVRRQEFPKRYLLDGSVLVLKPENLFRNRGIRKSHIYLGEKVTPIIQEEKIYTLELDVPEDIELLEYYMDKYGY